MKLQIERRYVESLIEAFPNRIALKEQLRFGNRAEVFYQQLAAQEWGFLHDLYQSSGAKSQAALLATLQTALNDGGERYEAEHLEKALPSITHYLIDDAQRGWLFQADAKGRTCAYLIIRLDYTPPGEEEVGRILIELKANSKGKIAIETLIIHAKDIAGKTIAEIFAAKEYRKRNASGALYDDPRIAVAAGRFDEVVALAEA